MSTKHFESARDAEIKRLKTELAKYDTPRDETTGLRIKIVELQKELAELKAEIERLKKPKGFHDVSDLYDDGITGRQWMIEQEASHE
ncbi:MAG TPA: hypothetical protein PLT63_03580 [Syntrophales bacterium]|nr:hypothetical protein [Syntrophales bacterium]